jgi:hypothetical protein
MKNFYFGAEDVGLTELIIDIMELTEVMSLVTFLSALLPPPKDSSPLIF